MKTLKQKSIFLVSSILLGTMFYACKKNNDGPILQGEIKIKVVNAAKGSNSQDFYQGDSKISTSAVAYGEASQYFNAKSGLSTLTFKNSGAASINASANFVLDNNGSFTFFYDTNASGSGQIKGYQDDNNAPPAGKSKVRFVNLGSVLNNTINVVVTGGASLITGLAYGNSSTYSTIDANTNLTASVLNSANLTTIPGTSFESGKIYTIWFDASSSTSVNFHVIKQN